MTVPNNMLAPFHCHTHGGFFDGSWNEDETPCQIWKAKDTRHSSTSSRVSVKSINMFFLPRYKKLQDLSEQSPVTY